MDLLPCPRCGGAPTVLELARGDLPSLWLVSCRNAHCGLRLDDGGTSYLPTQPEAVERWNGYAARPAARSLS